MPLTTFDSLIDEINELNLKFIDVASRFEDSSDIDIYEELNSISELRTEQIHKFLRIDSELSVEQQRQKKLLLEKIMEQDKSFISLFSEKRAEIKGELVKLRKRDKGVQAYKKIT